MKKLAPSFFLIAALLAAPSCVLVVGAGIGASAMYALGEDSIELYLDHPMNSVYTAAQAQIEDTGDVELEELGVKEAYISARVDDAEIDIFLTGVTENTTRMVVKARKWKSTAPDLDAAQSIADRIAYRAD